MNIDKKYIDTIHELTLGVQKVYRKSSNIEENSCGFDIYYNRSSITYYVLKKHDKILDVINKKTKKFNKINIYSNKELPFLSEYEYINGTSSSVNDNLIVKKNLTTKQLSKIRRANRFVKREGFEIVDATSQEITLLTDKWIENKLKDPHVYGITFNPKRYKNAVYFIDNNDYNFYNVKYNGNLIASICYYNKDNVSYQLTFSSDNTVKKIVNDQYELILWASFDDRFQNGSNIISMGTSGGITNLAYFKRKFYTNSQSSYSYKKINHTKGLFI